MFSWKSLWLTVLTLFFTPDFAVKASNIAAVAFFGTSSDW